MSEDYIDKSSKSYLQKISKREPSLHFNIDKKSRDNVIFLIETGGTEEEFKKIYKNYQEPYYLLTSGENNSLAASLEILTFLSSHHLKGEIIHGGLDEVASKLVDISTVEECLVSLKKDTLGVIGKPSDWLIASDVDYLLIKKKIGVQLIDITTKELIEEVNAVKEIKDFDKFSSFSKNKDVLTGALKIYTALKSLVRKYHLAGLTIRCFDLLGIFHNTSCLALAMLNQEGITATCEGDIPSLLTMHIARKLVGESSFQANPSRIYPSLQEMVLAHCTIPLDMCSSFKFDTHFESGLGIGIKGELKKSEITLVKFSPSLDRAIILSGKIIDNLSETRLCRTQIKVKFSSPIDVFLSNPIGNHEIILYGNYAKVFHLFLLRIN